MQKRSTRYDPLTYEARSWVGGEKGVAAASHYRLFVDLFENNVQKTDESNLSLRTLGPADGVQSCNEETGGNAFEVSLKKSEKSKVAAGNEPIIAKPTTTTIGNLEKKTRNETKRDRAR